MRCTNCGGKIKGKKPVIEGETGTQFFGFDDEEEEIIIEKVKLCSWPCAWEFGFKEHYWMSEKEAISHLISMHGYPQKGK